LQSKFLRDHDDPDKPVQDALSERPGQTIRIRVHPMIYRAQAGRAPQYQGWPQVCWTLECDSAQEAFATRDVMRAFFETLGRFGPSAVHRALDAINAVGQVQVPAPKVPRA
jgi:hypothetical protein